MRKDFDEKAIFDLFTDKENYREVLKRPFRIGDVVYASTGYRIIGIDAGLLKGEYSGDNVPEVIRGAIERYNATLLNCNRTVTAGQLERALASVPRVEEVIENDETEECPECHGRGVVTWHYDGRKQDYYEEFECPECDGEGYVTNTIKCKTGKMIPDEKAAIRFFFSLSNITAWNVRALLDTMNLLGIEEARLVIAERNISVFILNNGITVYIANVIGEPCYVIE